jgi:hypothetical protein
MEVAGGRPGDARAAPGSRVGGAVAAPAVTSPGYPRSTPPPNALARADLALLMAEVGGVMVPVRAKTLTEMLNQISYSNGSQ